MSASSVPNKWDSDLNTSDYSLAPSSAQTVGRAIGLDRKLLDILQSDATVQVADLAERVGLSQTPCLSRIQRLKEAGAISKNVVLVDRQRLNLGVTRRRGG